MAGMYLSMVMQRNNHFLHIKPQMSFNSPLNFLLLDANVSVCDEGNGMKCRAVRDN